MNNRFYEKDIDSMIEDNINGMSLGMVAKKWKTKEGTIRGIFQKERAKGNQKLLNYKTANTPIIRGELKERFLKLYVMGNMSVYDIAKTLFLLKKSVQQLILKCKLPLRAKDIEDIEYCYNTRMLRAFDIASVTYIPYKLVSEYIKEKYPKDDIVTKRKKVEINPYFLTRGKISNNVVGMWLK